jgi:hypothetical protein
LVAAARVHEGQPAHGTGAPHHRPVRSTVQQPDLVAGRWSDHSWLRRQAGGPARAERYDHPCALTSAGTADEAFAGGRFRGAPPSRRGCS